MNEGRTTVVLTDANALINLMHIDQRSLLKRLPGYRFVVPDHVIAEIERESQANALRQTIEDGILEPATITGPDEVC
jgi:rRNA-processing protein FCF1